MIKHLESLRAVEHCKDRAAADTHIILGLCESVSCTAPLVSLRFSRVAGKADKINSTKLAKITE